MDGSTIHAMSEETRAPAGGVRPIGRGAFANVSEHIDAFAIDEPIRGKWLALGGNREWLPLGNAAAEDAHVVVQHFVGAHDLTFASIVGRPDGTWIVRGEIRNKWYAHGGGAGPLGWPVEDARAGHVTGTTMQRFRHPDGGARGGSIVLRADGSVFEVHGRIHKMWAAEGFDRGLGLPESDKLASGDGRGAFTQFFGNGRSRIYIIDDRGPLIVRDPIFSAWYALGAEHGAFGYPIAPEEQASETGVRQARFEGGLIRASSDGTISTEPIAD